MSVDLWIDKVASHARIILVRILGGYDWWRYGCDRLSAMASANAASSWRCCPANAATATSG